MYGQRSSATIQELQEDRIINKAGKSAKNFRAKNFRTKRFLAPGAGRGSAWIKDFRAGALKPAWIKALRAGARRCPVYKGLSGACSEKRAARRLNADQRVASGQRARSAASSFS